MQNPRPSYAHHQLQQHLSSLLTAAAGEPPHPSEDAARAAALSNLRLAFLHPPNRPLLPSIAPFLAQPLSVLLADDASYAVRRAAVSAYGTLCAVLCSHEAPGGLPDGFVAWALPLLGDPSSAPLVSEGLRELLATGDAAAVERFVPPLLAACRDVLEDERTSLPVLRCLLGLLMLVAAKFPHCFRPQFVDIMDLLLGWAFVPDLADADRSMIMDSFTKFQRHWLGNLQFALGLLPKFLADMEVLVHDPNLAASHNSGRLRPLFACFSTVLQIMASGVAERNNLRELVAGPLEGLAPQLLRCAAVIASKLGWSERMEEAFRCLWSCSPRFCRKGLLNFYVMFVDVLAQSLELASSAQLVAALKTNLQVLSLQSLGLRTSSVGALLDFSSVLSRLRLHLNHTVVANTAATYLFCLQHGSEDVVDQAIASLMRELELLKSLLEEGQPKVRCHVASSLELLLLGRLINPMNFSVVTQVLLDKLSDPDSIVKNMFLRCHETDALVGLYKWSVSTFYTLFEQGSQLMQEALSMKSDGIQYIIERVIECYTSLSDWKCLESWLAELQVLRAIHAGKPYSGALTTAGSELNAIHAMSCFDEGDFHSAWSYLDLTPKSSSELSLDPKVALDRSEVMLLRAMLQSDSKSDRVREEIDKAKLMLGEALSVAPLDGLTEVAPYAGQLHCIFAFEEASGRTYQNEPNKSQVIMDSLLKVLHDPIDRIHQDCSMWLKVFKVYRHIQPSSLSTLRLCQKLASLARKQSNLLLASRLNQYLVNHPLKSSDDMDKEILELNIKYEGALLKHEEGSNEEALSDLWSLVRPSILSTISGSSGIGTSLSLIAKACLKLSTWMEQMNSTHNLNTFIPTDRDYPATTGCYSYAQESSITSLIEQAVRLIETAAGAPGSEAREEDTVVPFINKLIEFWWSLRKRRVSLFENAAHAYFQYLSFSSTELQPLYHRDALKGKTRSYTLRALLYLLHIMLNYALELNETLERGLSTVPLLPWQDIIPQLFACLSSHPEKIARKLLESILLKLGKLSPCSIVYPTLVDINACEGQPSEELQHILDFLVKLYPNLVKDVKLAIEELGMITVLWEEQWLSTLQDLHSDVLRRISVLKDEAARVAANSTLSSAEKHKINAAKYSAMMTPIIVALERRLASTSREPKTSHEMWFHKEYNAQLKSAITALKTPPGSPTALGEIWRPFDLIAAASLATHQRKSRILLSEIAPQLAVLSTSDIPMPGFEKQIHSSDSCFAGNHDAVTISSFYKEVTILSTKTRPKKLILQGSNGQRYTYLLKGREDLRLDSRIMQLLEWTSWTHPVGGKCKQHLQCVQDMAKAITVGTRTARGAQLSSVNTGSIHNAVPHVPRPSDMFYGKIIPALKEKGIKRVVSRRDWPLDVKRKVLLDLMKETPKQILWQEMWCASEGFRNFNSKVKRFSSSVAAMSMVGHMLGLGDRHLDNILMDFSNGDVVHIDYNICFDKGKRLKIPEIVPFRLTQTIESALGLTGVEGVFRVACESEHQDLFITNLPATLSALKKFLYILDQYEIASAIFYTVEKERSSALQNETSAKSVLADATSAAEKSRSSFEQHAHELAESKTVAIDEANKLAIWVEKYGRVLEVIRNNSVTGVESCMQLNCKDEALSLISAVVVSGVPLTVVPEPARAQCYELDMEVSQLISELHSGLSSALESLGEYALVLQQVLPVNYITTSPITNWAQILQLSVSSASQDMLTLAKRQAAEVIAKVQGESINLVQQRYRDLLNQIESYVACVERLAKECSELMNSIGSDNEVQSKKRILSLIRNSVQLPSQTKEGDNNHLSLPGSVGPGEIKGKDDIQGKVLSVLWVAVGQLYSDARAKVSDLSAKGIGRAKLRTDDADLQADAGMGLQLFDQQIEKCALVSGVVDEVHEATLRSSINMIEQMTENFVPEFIRSFVSCNSEVMEAIGSISQIRGSVDTALEKLIEVELDRASLTELEQSYFVKVGRITEQQIALEEAAARGREHLSWEEAEELASQEEVCRAQLEQLQETWSQKDLRISSLMKVEAGVMNSLHSSKQHLSTLLDADQESEFHLRRSTSLLSSLAKPFADLESLDNMLASRGSFPSHMDRPISILKELLSLGSPLTDMVWPSAGLLKDNAFFVWKISFLDSILDLCMREISSSVEHNFTTNQLYSNLKKKLAVHVEKQVYQYMAERIAPVLIQTLDEQINDMLHLSQGRRESDQPKRISSAVGRVALLLEEYCNAHETARAARTAVSLMKRQLNELMEALRKIILELVQFEWLHDLSSPHAQKLKVLSQNILIDDKFISVILNLSRSNLLDKIQSSVSLITRSIECLQACESTSMSAEGQLERAMGWACGGSNTSGAGGSSAKGAEQEWKLGQLNLEAAGKGLFSANNQETLVVMYESACEVSALLSGFKHVSQERTALTSECGSLLEEALEVHEEMETVKSQDVSSTHTDLLQSDSSIEKDRSSSESRETGSQDLVMNIDVSLHDGCWISPPENSFTSSSGCNTGLTQISSSDSLEKIDALMNDGVVIGLQANSQEKGDSYSNEALIDSVASTRASIHDDETRSVEGKVEFEGSSVTIKQVRGQECDNNDPKSYSDSPTRATRGKNPFALSILKQVEHKLHGSDIDSNRSMNISEQVDHLIKQATSIDNLCNMYEGWTPWI
ncbi:hypothetical protein PR202_gb11029 [Eleusine coracana subsp. coracana]|uniref:non-specific serine/threonine protein kinase n=1 Tax=Eleusine coracana subsp. coracana TaxID=191504 RepID=A0AAV5ELV4_ELECO|nr:hypothetical protein PR202_gb11029 [Eleusine coracana subsp. coracana]